MGMFFDVLSAINNPSLQGNVPQLEASVDAVQAFAAQNNLPPSAMQTMMSTLGGLLQGNMRQQTGMGLPQLTQLLRQDGGTSGNVTALQTLFPPQLQQQLVPVLAQKTGLSPALIQAALPTVIPAVMNLLKMGNPKPGGTTAANPLLTMFLDSDRDGDTDLGDVFNFANRFIHPSQTP
ncbi:MAG: DUF937 domain-containing protein [Cyanobacteria bacterium J06638_20]